MKRVLLILSIVGAVALGTTDAPARSPNLLYVSEGNNLLRFDIDSIHTPPLVSEKFIARASDCEVGCGGPVLPDGFRDMNGQICMIPDGSGRFIAGEDTGQPSPPPGWGVFSPEGVQIGKLTATYFVAQGEPHGCGFAPDGTLFTAEVGEQGFSTPSGQLIQWFPPYDHFPGPPGAYPNTNAASTNFCKIATDIGTAGGIAIDDQGRVYVASSSGLSIYRFSPPFPTSPDAEGGCGAVDGLGSPMADVVNRETFTGAVGGLTTWSGVAIAPNGNIYGSSVLTGEIFEFDTDGNVVRQILDPPDQTIPIPTGSPQDLAVGPDGTLYYADLSLVGTFPDLGPGPNGKVWRIRFDEFNDPLAPELIQENLAFPDALGILPGNLAEHRSFASGAERRYFNNAEGLLTPDNIGGLAVKWTFLANEVVTASPTVARVDVPGEGTIPVAYVQSWDGNVYALRASNGTELWRFETALQPGASFPGAASVHVENLDGTEIVYIGSGETFYAIDAITGDEIWHFEAGTGCGTGLCDFDGERNEIESSAFVADGKVFFGMDVNDDTGGKGGFYALDAADGRMVWYFDLETGSTCTPLGTDDIRRFDGYHSEVELGLPAGFLATRPGCNFVRSLYGCSNVWSSPAVDLDRQILYFGSSNCDTDNDPMTLEPPPPMPPYDEALVALNFDGTPAWRWRPREVDNDDLAFGAAPNLFVANIGGVDREVVGIGNKDGTYYVIDRDGENEVSGVRWDDVDPSTLPYWSTNVVAGGPIGGVIATAAVDQTAGRVYFTTGPGFSPFAPQQPTIHALDIDTGAVVWETGGDAAYTPMSAVPDLAFAGTVVGGFIRAYETDTGTLEKFVPLGLAVASGTAVVDGMTILGTGIGARSPDPEDPSEVTSRQPSNIVGLCVPGTSGCDLPISGRRIVLKGDPNPSRRRLSLRSNDRIGILGDAQGGAANPTVSGAVLAIVNPTTGETGVFDLPAGNWTGLGSPAGSSGYRYKDTALANGPCKKVDIRPGRFIKAMCKGNQIPFTLDEPAQRSIGATLTLGNGSRRYCMLFGGKVTKDRPETGASSGAFKAKNAPAPPFCPEPVVPSPSGAFIDRSSDVLM